MRWACPHCTTSLETPITAEAVGPRPGWVYTRCSECNEFAAAEIETGQAEAIEREQPQAPEPRPQVEVARSMTPPPWRAPVIETRPTLPEPLPTIPPDSEGRRGVSPITVALTGVLMLSAGYALNFAMSSRGKPPETVSHTPAPQPAKRAQALAKSAAPVTAARAASAPVSTPESPEQEPDDQEDIAQTPAEPAPTIARAPARPTPTRVAPTQLAPPALAPAPAKATTSQASRHYASNTDIQDSLHTRAMAPRRYKPDDIQLYLQARRTIRTMELRTGPGTEFPLMGLGDLDERYPVLEIRNRWFRVQLEETPGLSAWVAYERVELFSHDKPDEDLLR